MGVIVAGMIVLVFFLRHRDHAAVRRLADHVLQLDRRMVDAEPVP
jgi:hypothetical protein